MGFQNQAYILILMVSQHVGCDWEHRILHYAVVPLCGDEI